MLPWQVPDIVHQTSHLQPKNEGVPRAYDGLNPALHISYLAVLTDIYVKTGEYLSPDIDKPLDSGRLGAGIGSVGFHHVHLG